MFTLTTGNLKFAECSTFAECIVSSTRQIRSLPSVPQKTLGKINTHGKQFFVECIIFWHSAKMRVCRVFFLHSANSSLPSVLFLALGKDYDSPSVFFTLGKELKIFPLSTSKNFLLSTYNMCYSMLKFGTFLYLFAIFN